MTDNQLAGTVSPSIMRRRFMQDRFGLFMQHARRHDRSRMTACAHCGTEFAGKDGQSYCCAGCEYVAGLIADHGFDRFYDLKGGAAVAPVRGRPF
jgi:Cu2+-exporting ATPase